MASGADPNALTPDEYAQTPMHAAFLGSADVRHHSNDTENCQ